MRRFDWISAAVLVGIGACGDDGAPLAPDAPAIGDVSVTTLVRCCSVAQGTAQAGVPVIAVQPDGSAGPTGTSDAEGKVTLHGVQQGAWITAAYPEDANLHTELVSTLDVKPGDNLTYGGGYYAALRAGTPGTMTINVPAVATAKYYLASTPCGSTGVQAPTLAIPVALSATCQSATAPIVVVAADSTDAIIASAYLAAAPFTDTAAVTVPSWTSHATATDFSTTITGVGAEVTDVVVGAQAAATPSLDLTGNAIGVTLVAGSGAGSVSIPLAYPHLTGYAYLFRDGFGQHRVSQGVAAGMTSASVAAPALPWVGGVVGNGALGRIDWVQTAGTYTAAVVSASWTRYNPGSQTAHFFYWRVVLPAGATSIDFSAPPATLAQYIPRSTDAIGGIVALVELSNAPSYDALRALPEWQVADPEVAVDFGDVPAASVAMTFGGNASVRAHH